MSRLQHIHIRVKKAKHAVFLWERKQRSVLLFKCSILEVICYRPEREKDILIPPQIDKTKYRHMFLCLSSCVWFCNYFSEQKTISVLTCETASLFTFSTWKPKVKKKRNEIKQIKTRLWQVETEVTLRLCVWFIVYVMQTQVFILTIINTWLIRRADTIKCRDLKLYWKCFDNKTAYNKVNLCR